MRHHHREKGRQKGLEETLRVIKNLLAFDLLTFPLHSNSLQQQDPFATTTQILENFFPVLLCCFFPGQCIYNFDESGSAECLQFFKLALIKNSRCSRIEGEELTYIVHFWWKFQICQKQLHCCNNFNHKFSFKLSENKMKIFPPSLHQAPSYQKKEKLFPIQHHGCELFSCLCLFGSQPRRGGEGS